MSEQGKQIDNDLTTDAIPSPPRDEIKHKENNEQSDDQKTYRNAPPSSASHKTSSKSKPMGFTRAKKQNPTAFATVINISGSNGIHIGSNYNMYMNNKPDTNKKQENNKKHNKEYVVTEEINTLLTSSTNVDKNHIFKIAPHFNEQWQDVARSLLYSEGQISQFQIDHIHSGIKEVIIQFLLDWMRNDDEPTVGKLSKALWENNHQDVVQIWSKSFNK